MARFAGIVGYSVTKETAPGVWTETTISRRMYRGDTIRNSKRAENGTDLNDNIVINNSISIVADAYAYQHFFAIKYVEWMGTKWKVTNVEVQRPRLILTLGGVWNGD